MYIVKHLFYDEKVNFTFSPLSKYAISRSKNIKKNSGRATHQCHAVK